MNTLQGQATALEQEVAELNALLAAEHQRLGLDSQPGSPLPSLSPRTLAMLRSAAGAVRKAQQRLAQAQQCRRRGRRRRPGAHRADRRRPGRPS